MRAAKTLLLVCLVGAACAKATAADGGGDRPAWRLFDRRLGMFVHWGVYAVDGYHEQQRMRQRLGRADYERRAASFTASAFSADAYVDAAESLGAEYIVFTAKHHDGFCLWNTKTTDFNVMNTPAKRDVVGELAAACRRRGMRLGLYYSNPDWHHPQAYNPRSTHQVPPEAGDGPDMDAYRAYVKAQVTELLTRYGEIACLFWDIQTKIPAPEMNALVRRLQPGILVNDRGWGEKGDYSTPERSQPDGGTFSGLVEACDSVGAQSWGYRATEDYRTLGYVTRAIDRILTRGGNFLLNVGPRADGAIPDEALSLLARTGEWYRRVRVAYRQSAAAPEIVGSDGVLAARRGKKVFLHYANGLSATGVKVRPFREVPRRVSVLNTGEALKAELTVLPSDWERSETSLHIYGIPADRLANESVVLELEF